MSQPVAKGIFLRHERVRNKPRTNQDETVSVTSNDQHREKHVSRPYACVINLRAILGFLSKARRQLL